MAVTDHFDLPLPDETRNVDDEFRQLIITLQMIDVILKSIRDTALAAAPEGHGHQLGDVAGLVDALASKMPASAAFALDNLTDVSGAAAAPNGHVLAKLAGGWSPVSAAAAIGNHQHAMGDIAGLAAALAAKLGLEGGTTSGPINVPSPFVTRAAGAGQSSYSELRRGDNTVAARMSYVAGGTPYLRVGIFNPEGSTWTNYIDLPENPATAPSHNGNLLVTAANFPSQLNQQFYAGAMLPFAMSSAPTGWLKCNGAAVSRTTYSRLFTAIGTIFGAGDGSTTFNLPDLRGEFVRGWDDGRGIDAGRAFGSLQLDAYQAHTHPSSGGNVQISGIAGSDAFFQTGSVLVRLQEMGTGTGRTATETRPRNVAMLWCIKW